MRDTEQGSPLERWEQINKDIGRLEEAREALKAELENRLFIVTRAFDAWVSNDLRNTDFYHAQDDQGNNVRLLVRGKRGDWLVEEYEPPSDESLHEVGERLGVTAFRYNLLPPAEMERTFRDTILVAYSYHPHYTDAIFLRPAEATNAYGVLKTWIVKTSVQSPLISRVLNRHSNPSKRVDPIEKAERALRLLQTGSPIPQEQVVYCPFPFFP